MIERGIVMLISDMLKGMWWALLIAAVVLFSTGGYQSFIYQNF